MKNVIQAQNRLYFLDWLRVLAMFGIFFFHNARLFDEFSDWHVKNATTNLGASTLVAFLSLQACVAFQSLSISPMEYKGL